MRPWAGMRCLDTRNDDSGLGAILEPIIDDEIDSRNNARAMQLH